MAFVAWFQPKNWSARRYRSIVPASAEVQTGASGEAGSWKGQGEGHIRFRGLQACRATNFIPQAVLPWR